MISARTLELLRLGLIDTEGQIHMDLALLDGRSVNEGDTQVLDDLPDVVKNRPGSWLEGFRRTCSDLISDIESGGEPRPRCTAEEFVLGLTMTRLEDFVTLNYAIAEAAVAHLPASDDDFNLDAAHSELFQDADLDLLYVPALDGFLDDPDLLAREGIQMLQPDRWFEWFANAHPRPDPTTS